MATKLKLQSVTALLALIASVLGQLALLNVAMRAAGLEFIGLFGLIQGIVIISRIMDVGAGLNITRRVALAQTQDDVAVQSASLYFAGLLAIFVPTILLAAATYFPALVYLRHVAGPEFDATIIKAYLAIALLASILAAYSAVALCVVEGLGRLVTKNAIVASAALGGALCGIYGLLTYGPIGLAFAPLATMALQAGLSSVVLLRACQPGLTTGLKRAFPVFKTILPDSLKLNLIGVLRLGFEPVTKILLGNQNAFDVLALFEIALRITGMARNAVQSAIQPLLVFGARAEGELTQELRAVFRQSNIAAAKVARTLGYLLLSGAPLVSYIIFGDVRASFFTVFALLVVSAAINMVGVVGYYYALSAGALDNILRVHIHMAVINLGGGLLGGALWGGVGIVASYALTFVYGGVTALSFLQPIAQVKVLTHFWSLWGLHLALLPALAAALWLAPAGNGLLVGSVLSSAALSAYLGWLVYQLLRGRMAND